MRIEKWFIEVHDTEPQSFPLLIEYFILIKLRVRECEDNEGVD